MILPKISLRKQFLACIQFDVLKIYLTYNIALVLGVSEKLINSQYTK